MMRTMRETGDSKATASQSATETGLLELLLAKGPIDGHATHCTNNFHYDNESAFKQTLILEKKQTKIQFI